MSELDGAHPRVNFFFVIDNVLGLKNNSSVLLVTSSNNYSYVIERTQEKKARYEIEVTILEFLSS